MTKTRNPVEDLRAASKLAVEATKGVTDLVEAMHQEIASGPDLLGRPLEGPVRLLTGLVYDSIRGVTGIVGAGIDLALAQLAPLLGANAPGPEREAVLAALNGVLGDYLAETGNPLAIPMRLRAGGRPLELTRVELGAAFPEAKPRLLVMVHGSSMNDRQLSRLGHLGHDHGAALARDLDASVVYLHYNSGLHISTNGRAFAALLEALVGEWPVPVDTLAIVGHSMGGLVARSACLQADPRGRWRPVLRKLVCLGSPHHGAPLERAGNVVGLLFGISRYSAPLGRLARIRSAGVTDMRFGNVLDEHWMGRDRFAHGADPRANLSLPDGVDCFAAAGTLSPGPGKRLRSDGIVPVESALGVSANPALDLAFPEAHRWIGYGMGHLDLLGRPEVLEVVRAWLAPDPRP